jgi:lipoprotein-anchoring transpeptidase ErfK/SrfK
VNWPKLDKPAAGKTYSRGLSSGFWHQIDDILAFFFILMALALLGVISYVGWTAYRSSDIPSADNVTIKSVAQIQPTDDQMPATNTPTSTPQKSPTGVVNAENSNNSPLPTPTQVGSKPVVSGAKPRARWTSTPEPTPTPTPSPTPAPTFVAVSSASTHPQPVGLAPGEKWIDVDLSEQHLTAYEGSVPVFQSLVSTGTAAHPTVTGQFRIWLRFQSQDMDGYRLGFNYYLRNVPYVQYFYQDYALHGTFWHNNFGTPMSHGCVNLPTPAAEWLFFWSDYGTLVNIHI